MIELDDSTGAHGQNPGAETGKPSVGEGQDVTKPKRRGGPGLGNTNRVTHGAHLDPSVSASGSRGKVAESRKALAEQYRQDEAWAAEMVASDLASLGLDAGAVKLTSHLLTVLVRRQRALGRYIDGRALVTRKGAPIPALAAELASVEKLVGELRRVLAEAADYARATHAGGPQEYRVVMDLTHAVDAVDVDGRIICARCGAERGHRDDHGFKDDHPDAQAPACATSASPAMPAPSVEHERALEPPAPSSDDDDFPGEAMYDIAEVLEGGTVLGKRLEEIEDNSPADRELHKRFGVHARFARLLSRPSSRHEDER